MCQSTRSRSGFGLENKGMCKLIPNIQINNRRAQTYGVGETPLNRNGVGAILKFNMCLKNSQNIYGNIEKLLFDNYIEVNLWNYSYVNQCACADIFIL